MLRALHLHFLLLKKDIFEIDRSQASHGSKMFGFAIVLLSHEPSLHCMRY
jgi:hypothetical protein